MEWDQGGNGSTRTNGETHDYQARIVKLVRTRPIDDEKDWRIKQTMRLICIMHIMHYFRNAFIMRHARTLFWVSTLSFQRAWSAVKSEEKRYSITSIHAPHHWTHLATGWRSKSYWIHEWETQHCLRPFWHTSEVHNSQIIRISWQSPVEIVTLNCYSESPHGNAIYPCRCMSLI